MKIKFTLLFILLNVALYSQKSSEYDYGIPLPPESYQFKKRLINNVSLYTGQPSIDIPIYSIDLDGMEVPISISYNTGGIKVEEDATSVGLGWSLNIGGQITRNNHGAPDERYFMHQDYSNKNTFGIGRLKTSIDPNESTQFDCRGPGVEHGSRSQFYAKAFLAGNDIRNSYGNEDTRPDEFYYSFFGHSGKFMFSQELKKFITFPLDDISIDYELVQRTNSNYFDNFSIKLPNGYNLVLGKDGTSSISEYGSTPFDQSWQIKKIISTKNKEIIYNYTSADYNLYTNLATTVSQVITRSTREKTARSYESNITSTKEKLVSEIIFPAGKIVFIYTERVDLQSGAKKLQEIKIYDNSGNLIKRVQLVQDYFNANVNLFDRDAVDKRLRLNAINFYDLNNKVIERYTFDYYLFNKIPSKSSKAQDHWGYFNGEDSNRSLFPENLLPEYHVAGNNGFNRNLDTLYTKTFSLKSIKFPEGGVKHYDYENHTALPGPTTANYYDAISDARYKIIEPYFTVTGTLQSFYPPANEETMFNKTYYSEPFETTIHSSSLKSSETSILLKSDFPFKAPNYSSINSAFNKVEFYLDKKQDDGTFEMLKYLGTISKDENPTGVINGYFEVGGKGTYRMRIVITQNYVIQNPPYVFHVTSFNIKYREEIKEKGEGGRVGGLRIKGIHTYENDNLRDAKYTTYFKYLDDNNMSSGKMMNVPSYVESISLGRPDKSADSGLTLELGIRLSSSSVLSLYKTSGSNVGYTKVSKIDYDHTTKAEIKEDNYFSFKEPLFSEIPLFDDFREDEPQEWHRGKLLRKLFYNDKNIIKEEVYDYYGKEVEKNMGYVDEINYELLDQNELCTGTSYVSKHIFPSGVSFPNILKDIPSYPYMAFAYDGVYAANKYTIENYLGRLKIPYFKIYTGFDKLKSKTVKSYFKDGIVEESQEYFYNSLPNSIELTLDLQQKVGQIF